MPQATSRVPAPSPEPPSWALVPVECSGEGRETLLKPTACTDAAAPVGRNGDGAALSATTRSRASGPCFASPCG